MDAKTKRIIGVALILLGIAAIGAIGYDYIQYLDAKNSAGIFSGLIQWQWTSQKIFQIAAGLISAGAGILIIYSSSEAG
jgi:hypothetical protein